MRKNLNVISGIEKPLIAMLLGLAELSVVAVVMVALEVIDIAILPVVAVVMVALELMVIAILPVLVVVMVAL